MGPRRADSPTNPAEGTADARAVAAEWADAASREITSSVRRVARSHGLSAKDPQVDDVVQEVFARLLDRPPRDGSRGLSVIRAWAKRVASNLVTDLHRAQTRLDTQRRTSGEQTYSPCATEHRHTLHAIADVLRAGYPLGHRLFLAMCRAPDATTAELALALDTSPDNIHQIRTRMRKLLRDHGLGYGA